MSKRTRTEISQSDAYDTATFTQLKSFEKGRDVPTKYALYKSIPNTKLKDNFSFKTLRDMLFPIFRSSMDREAWGLTNYSQINPPNHMDTLTETNTFTSNDNKQGWTTFIVLPCRNIATTTQPTFGFQNGFLTLHDLIVKAKDVNNTMLHISPDPITNFLTDTERNLIYLGGKAKFTIINTNTIDVTVTTHVSKPKHMLPFDPIGAAVPQSFHRTLPAHFALDDKLCQVPLRNTAYPTTNNTNPNNSDDLTFYYSTTDSRRLYNYNTVSKTHKLVPGQTLEVILEIPPFTFTESQFLISLTNRAVSTEKPNFLPFCTQILDIQWRGELTHNQTYTSLGHSDARLQIHRRETHTMRAGIYNPPFQQLIEYQRDGVAIPGDIHINEETQEEVAEI